MNVRLLSRIVTLWLRVVRWWTGTFLHRKLLRWSEGGEALGACAELIWGLDWLDLSPPVVTPVGHLIVQWHPWAALVLVIVGGVHLAILLLPGRWHRHLVVLALRKFAAAIGFTWWLALLIGYNLAGLPLSGVLPLLLALLLFYSIFRQES